MSLKHALVAAALFAGGLAAAGSTSAQIPAQIRSPIVIPAVPVTEPAFQLFDRFCLSTRGDVAAGLAVADAGGWPEAPPEVVGEDPTKPKVYARMAPPLSEAGQTTMVAISEGTMDGRPSGLCMVDLTGSHLDIDVFSSLVGTRLGVEPRQKDGENVWTYSGAGPYVDEGGLLGEGGGLLDAARDRAIYVVAVWNMRGRRALALVRVGE